VVIVLWHYPYNEEDYAMEWWWRVIIFTFRLWTW